MELGDQVIYYTHESNDLGPDIVRDQLAFVLGIPSEGCVDVMIAPPGGPLRFERVCEFYPDDIYNVPGGSYVREAGTEPPDFDEPLWPWTFPEWGVLVRRQIAERNATPTPDQEALAEKHKQKQDQLRSELEKRRPKEEPAT